jgi:hypothetical protein
MNPIIYIILAILLIVILYYLYLYFTSTNIIAITIPLNKPTPYNPILSTNSTFNSNSINNIQNIKYTYGVWIYINNLSQQIGQPNNTNSKYSLFSFGNLNTNDITNPNFTLYMDSNNSSMLNVDILCSMRNKTIVINPSFPVQKWTNVIVSIDTNFIDIYQDGKLIISSKIDSSIDGYLKIPTLTSGICFGCNQDITLGNFMRWPYPIDPSTAYNVYYQGNGQPNGNSNGTHFHIWSQGGDNSTKTNLFSY